MTFIRAHRYHDAESLDGGTGTVTTSHGSCGAAPGARPDVSSVAATLVRPEVADTPGPTTSATAESDRALHVSSRSFDGNSLLPHEPAKSANKSAWFSQSGPNVEGEARLVGAGEAALRAGDPGSALTLFDEHAHRFPKGVLEQERRGVAFWRFAHCIESRRPAPTPTCFFANSPTHPFQGGCATLALTGEAFSA